MRRLTPIVVALALLVILPSATPPDAASWGVKIKQYGIETRSVQAGSFFEVQGNGFYAPVLPVKVCLSGAQCQLAELDPAGNFVVTRSIDAPGEYTVTIHQGKGLPSNDWLLRAWKKITVTSTARGSHSASGSGNSRRTVRN